MNWIIILLLSCFGLLMGMLAVKGYTHKIEPFLWLLFAVVSIIVVNTNIDERVFIHGLCIGLMWGILNGWTQAVFFKSYIANNPALKENFDKITFMPARLFPLLSGPVIGLISGLILGGLCFLVRKLW